MRLRKATSSSTAFTPDYSTGLARAFNLKNTDKIRSQLNTIHDNAQALAWRLYLIEQAEYSIDAQYYSWHLDTSGLILMDRLIEAADRGVRVRILLDDIHIFGIDRQIATLNSHANIEVRLFNPFTYRSRFRIIRTLELLFKLSRLNHRMHNKLLVVDNLIAILGGRNIGDEYLGLHSSLVFRDLDLLLAGSCIAKLSESFDQYWNHNLSQTIHKLIALRPQLSDLNHLRDQISGRIERTHASVSYIQHLVNKLRTKIKNETCLPISGKVDVLSDVPEFDKTTGKQVIAALYNCSLNVREQISIVSAYFIPDDNLLATMRTAIKQGVAIRLYTNSLASIDVTVAFSGYQKYRQQLIDMGIELHELRDQHVSVAKIRKRYTLHAKCIVYDQRRVYVGTLNLDPRSASLNTEVGLLIDSPQLAENLLQQLQHDKHEYWRVQQNSHSGLRWIHGDSIIRQQPSRGVWQGYANWLFSLLPIKRHL